MPGVLCNMTHTIRSIRNQVLLTNAHLRRHHVAYRATFGHAFPRIDSLPGRFRVADGSWSPGTLGPGCISSRSPRSRPPIWVYQNVMIQNEELLQTADAQIVSDTYRVAGARIQRRNLFCMKKPRTQRKHGNTASWQDRHRFSQLILLVKKRPHMLATISSKVPLPIETHRHLRFSFKTTLKRIYKSTCTPKYLKRFEFM